MKSLLLLVFIILMQNVNATIFGVIVSYNNKLIFYDIENNSRKDIISIENLSLWEFGRCYSKNGDYILTLYKSSDYHYFNKTGYISEMVVNFDGENAVCKIDTIIKKEAFYRQCDSTMEKLTISNIKDLYCYRSSLSDDAGSIHIKDSVGNVIPILKPKQVENGYSIGFFNPSLSPKGNRIVCEKIFGKHNWKKRHGKSVIVEYDIEKELFNEWNLVGKRPLYSKDGCYLLYQSGKTCCVYDINNKKELLRCNGEQAIWVDL